MRRFENTSGKHNKFWEVVQEGRTHYVRFGRMGSGGWKQSKPVAHDNTADAVKAVEKLIRSKLGKGYVEVTKAPEVKTKRAGRTVRVKPVAASAPSAGGFLARRRVRRRKVEHSDG